MCDVERTIERIAKQNRFDIDLVRRVYLALGDEQQTCALLNQATLSDWSNEHVEAVLRVIMQGRHTTLRAKWKFGFEVSLRDIALPLRIDFDWRVTGPFIQIQVLGFKVYWYEEVSQCQSN
jgi:hypothetical protein